MKKKIKFRKFADQTDFLKILLIEDDINVKKKEKLKIHPQ